MKSSWKYDTRCAKVNCKNCFWADGSDMHDAELVRISDELFGLEWAINDDMIQSALKSIPDDVKLVIIPDAGSN